MNNVTQSEPLTILDRLRAEEKTVHNDMIGQDGNAFAIMGNWSQAAKREGRNGRPGKEWTEDERNAVLTECTTGNYDHLLVTIMEFSRDENHDSKDDEEKDEEYGDHQARVNQRSTDYYFVDAQEMHKQHPDTFEVPTEENLKALKPGDTIKVCVNNQERFWCIITAIDGDPIQTIHATVDNELIFPGLKLGDSISLQHKHIYSIYQ